MRIIMDNKKFYFAPLEGITWYLYRNAHNLFFPGIEKYFAPFIVASKREEFNAREFNDLTPEHNVGIRLIPQILTNKADDFLHTAKRLEDLGYREINLNLGCPSGTVVSKHKGSGFLAKQEELDRFLEDIFAGTSVAVSIKTRIGKDDPEEFHKLLEIFNRYPLEELIVHPRVQKDFYKNSPNMSAFAEAVKVSKNPICYNGDIVTADDYSRFTSDFSGVDKIMLGRGLIRNPALMNEFSSHTKVDKAVLKEFHDKVYSDYKMVLSGDRNVLFRMKEIWAYMIGLFSDYEKYIKKIRKSQNCHEYEEAVNALFRDREILA